MGDFSPRGQAAFESAAAVVEKLIEFPSQLEQELVVAFRQSMVSKLVCRIQSELSRDFDNHAWCQISNRRISREPVDRKRDSAIDTLFDSELTSCLLFNCDNVGCDLECAESGASSGFPGVGEFRPEVVSDIIGLVLGRNVQVITYEPRPSVVLTVIDLPFHRWCRCE